MTYEEQWTCAICGHTYVVPTMARHCEQRHEMENG